VVQRMPDLNLGHSIVFSTVGARAVANAIQHKAYDPNKFSPTYALLSRMRWSSSTDVLASAEEVIQHIFSTYSEPNLAPEEFQSRAAKRGESIARVQPYPRRRT